MKKFVWVAFCALVGVVPALAQEMNVIRRDLQVDSFNLADIDSVTFTLRGPELLPVIGARDNNDILRVHVDQEVTSFPVGAIDSLCYSPDMKMTLFLESGESQQFDLAEVDSLTFAGSQSNLVTITYNGSTVVVDNPLEGAGVTIEVSDGDVIVTAAAGIEGITYALHGASSDGMFKIYSDEALLVQLHGVEITNANGPVINSQTTREVRIELVDGTATTLTDGVTYAAPPQGEDQKGAIFSEGNVVFTGPGSLVLHGRGSGKHGLASDGAVEIRDGSVRIQSAVKDAVHTNDGYLQSGGLLEVVSTMGDGVDGGDGPVVLVAGAITIDIPAADCDALKCGGLVEVTGGTVALTIEGDQSKGFNAAEVRLTGGTVTVETSGDVVLEPAGAGYDPSYCSAIKADALVLLDGCAMTVTTSGLAGRGISCDGAISILSGTLDITSTGNGGTYTNEDGVIDAYHGPCLNADGDLELGGGSIHLSHSGSGGKGVSGDSDLSIGTAISSPTLEVTAVGPPIPLGGGEYAEAKAISVDSTVVIANGQIAITTVDDAIKAKVQLEVNGGLINILDCKEGMEAPNLFINAGEIHLRSSDDGLNATYGDDVEYDDGSILTINGGYVHLDAVRGDGIDSNGNLTFNGGTIIVHGPPNQPEVGLDVNGPFLVHGSFAIVSQINSSMLEVPSNQSTQRSVMLRRSQTLPGGTLFHIEDTSGNSLVTFRPARNYSAILLSTEDLISGTTYRVYTGGTCTGTERDGLYTGGTYAGGTLRATFTSSGIVQNVNF